MAEERAKQEAETARLKAEQEAARAKAELEAAKAKAEAEARALAEKRAKQEAEAARLKAEQEAARVKAELEAAKAKAKAEAEARALAEERAKQEAEAARLKAEQEAARAKAELEAAKAKAEAEARALAEERAKQEAEAARLKAEQESARVKAELEAAKAKAEAEARALAEERAKQEAEAARLKAEQETAQIKAEMEAAKIKAEAETKALTEEHARHKADAARFSAEHEAEIARLKAEQEATRIKTEVAAAKVRAEAEALAEERVKQEADVVRLKAEQEAARVRAESENQALAEERVKQEAELVRLKAEQEAARNIPEDERVNLELMRREQARRDAEKIEQEAAALRANQESQRLADEQAKAWADAERRAKEQAKIQVASPVQPVTAAAAKVRQQKNEKVRRKPLPVGKIALGLLVFTLLSVVILPYVLPLKGYIAPIEQKLSAQFKQPVHVGNLSASTLPPRLKLAGVTIGEAQELKVGNAIVTFNPFSIFSAVKEVRSVDLIDVTVAGAVFGKQLAWLLAISDNANFPVSHVTVQHAKMEGEEISLPVFNGEIDIEQGKVSKVAIRSDDAKFDVGIQPAQERWLITLNVKEAAFPVFPNVLFSDLSAKGELSADEVSFASIEGQAYGGFLSGKAKLNWQNGWQLQGRIEARSVELGKLLPKLSVTGELAGEGNFTASSSKLIKLAENQQMEGVFVVKKGVVNGLDMVETARLGNRQNASGGRTHFDELTGNFQANGRAQHFQQLRITSGILSGSGAFDVNSGSQITGRFSVDLKSRGGTSSMALSGTLTEPVLRSNR